MQLFDFVGVVSVFMRRLSPALFFCCVCVICLFFPLLFFIFCSSSSDVIAPHGTRSICLIYMLKHVILMLLQSRQIQAEICSCLSLSLPLFTYSIHNFSIFYFQQQQRRREKKYEYFSRYESTHTVRNAMFVYLFQIVMMEEKEENKKITPNESMNIFYNKHRMNATYIFVFIFSVFGAKNVEIFFFFIFRPFIYS